MPPYKTPEWVARARRNWLKGQRCKLCGHAGNGLAVIRHADSPALKWTLRGPNHHQLDVVCVDAGDCLLRRQRLGASKPAAVVAHVCKRGIVRPSATRTSPPRAKPKPKPPRPLERHELPIQVERQSAAVARLEKGLAKPDDRPVCPTHGRQKGGGSNTMIYGGAVRFTCCGRVVPGAKVEQRARVVV